MWRIAIKTFSNVRKNIVKNNGCIFFDWSQWWRSAYRKCYLCGAFCWFTCNDLGMTLMTKFLYYVQVHNQCIMLVSRLLINWLLFNIILQIIITTVTYLVLCWAKLKIKTAIYCPLWQLSFLHQNRSTLCHVYYNVLLIILTFFSLFSYTV